MTDDLRVEDADEADAADLDEIGRLAYKAVLRRLRQDETRPLGDTSLSRYASWHREVMEARRLAEEASRPKPEENVARADDFLSELRRIRANDGMTDARMGEILKTYTVLCEEHLEEARAFEKELADVPA